MNDDNLQKYEQHRRADLIYEYVCRWHALGLVGGTVDHVALCFRFTVEILCGWPDDDTGMDLEDVRMYLEHIQGNLCKRKVAKWFKGTPQYYHD